MANRCRRWLADLDYSVIKLSFKINDWFRNRVGDEFLASFATDFEAGVRSGEAMRKRFTAEVYWTLLYGRGERINRMIQGGDWHSALRTLELHRSISDWFWLREPFLQGLPLESRLTPRIDWLGLVRAIRGNQQNLGTADRVERMSALRDIIELLELRNEYRRFKSAMRPERAQGLFGGLYIAFKNWGQEDYAKLDEAAALGRKILKEDFGYELPPVATYRDARASVASEPERANFTPLHAPTDLTDSEK